jgi:glycosyltransferase involved in cell wall biosynthesis
MRIVLPVHHFPPRYSAGAELYTYRLARWLQTHGHEVEVIAIESIDRGSNSQIDAVHDQYDGIPVWRLSFNLLNSPQRRRWEFDNELLGEWFEGYFRRQQPDVAHFQAGYLLGVAPVFAAHRQQIPIVLTLHDFWYLCPQHTLLRSDGALCAKVPDDPLTCARCRLWNRTQHARWGRVLSPSVRSMVEKLPLGADAALMALRRERTRAALHCVKTLIAPSKFMYSQFEPVTEAGKVVFSRIGFDDERLHHDEQRGTGAALRFGYIGQIAAHKGVHVLIDAFQRLNTSHKPAELHIWGGLEVEPAYTMKLRKLAAANPRIMLHGRFESSQLSEVLGAFDYGVAPSIWFENCPISILEAYAAGIPVIASNLGGMAELVNDDQDGKLFAAGDATDLASKMQNILNDSALNARLQQGARQRILRNTDSEMEQVLAIYRNVASLTQLVA